MTARAQPRVVLRLVTNTPSTGPTPRTSPALDAALAAARDALSAAMLGAGRRDGRVTSMAVAAVAKLGRSLRTRDRADVLTLASALAALAVEAADVAHDLTAAGDTTGDWSDRADDGTRCARAAAVLLASLPRSSG